MMLTGTGLRAMVQPRPKQAIPTIQSEKYVVICFRIKNDILSPDDKDGFNQAYKYAGIS